MMLLVLFPVIIIVALVISYFISRRTYQQLIKSNNHYPIMVSISVFILSFSIMFMIILYLTLSNIELRR